MIEGRDIPLRGAWQQDPRDRRSLCRRERGGETAVNARIALSLFLRREHKYAEALPLVRILIGSYPRNFLFALEKANLLNALGQ